MRRLCCTVGLLIGVLGQTGCPNKQNLRPPKPPEEFLSPPDEKRYIDTPSPPADALNQQDPTKKPADPSAPGSMGNGARGAGGGFGH